jgi:uncharacterized protein (TIGR03086 family)
MQPSDRPDRGGGTLPDVVEQWNQVAEGFTARLDAVRADQWDALTPCPEWTVRQLVEHAIGAQRMMARARGATGVVDAPTGDDPRPAWQAVRAAAAAAYSEPAEMDQIVKMPFGEMPARDALAIPMGDLLVHTWDLARATGGDERLDAQAVAAVYEGMKLLPEEIVRTPQIFGPKVDPPAGANLQTQMLCFTGRSP